MGRAERDEVDGGWSETASEDARHPGVVPIDGIAAPVAVPDRSGTVLVANPTMSGLLGVPGAFLPGRRLSHFAPDGVPLDWAALAEESLDLGSPNGSVRRRLVRADGSLFWGALDVRALPADAAEPCRFVAQVLDVTDDVRQRAAHDTLVEGALLMLGATPVRMPSNPWPRSSAAGWRCGRSPSSCTATRPATKRRRARRSSRATCAAAAPPPSRSGACRSWGAVGRSAPSRPATTALVPIWPGSTGPCRWWPAIWPKRSSAAGRRRRSPRARNATAPSSTPFPAPPIAAIPARRTGCSS